MKLFVWDFHGVLEKDNDLAVLEITNKVLEQEGYEERLSKEKANEFYGLKWYEYFEQILPLLTNKEHMALQASCFKYCEDHLDVLANHIKVNDYAVEVLGKINNSKNDQIILSNTRQSDLLWFIDTVGIKKFFTKSKIFGVNAHEKFRVKSDVLAHYLKSKEFDTIIIIGDSESDMELKNVAGGLTYFYNHPSFKLNNVVKTDFIITDLREILKQI
ncbi:MAG: HAD hydrolase-like protein [Candidatus Saccharimonadales bacterium]